MNDSGEQATDKLLFQYLEGQLTEEQTNTLEVRLSVDPSLRSELELWQAAFVQPEDCDTTKLEGQLLKETIPPAGATAFRRGPVLVLTTALFLAMLRLTEPPPVAEKTLHRPSAAEKATTHAPATKSPVRTPDRAPQPVVDAAPGRLHTRSKMSHPDRADHRLHRCRSLYGCGTYAGGGSAQAGAAPPAGTCAGRDGARVREGASREKREGAGG